MSAHDQISELKRRMQQSIIGQETVVERVLSENSADEHSNSLDGCSCACPGG